MWKVGSRILKHFYLVAADECVYSIWPAFALFFCSLCCGPAVELERGFLCVSRMKYETDADTECD